MSFAQEPKPGAPMPVAAKTSGFAIASLVFGLLALFCVMPLIGSLLALVFGIVAIVKISGSEGRLKGGVMAGIGMASGGLAILFLPCVIALLLPAVQAVREAARRNSSINNMRFYGTAASMVDSQTRRLPPAGEGPNGERHPMSWRVWLLPFMEEDLLYNKLRAAGSNGEMPQWDDPAVADLVKHMPLTYRNPSQYWPDNETNYLVVTGPGTIYDPQQFPRGVGRSDIARADGASMTVWLVEADADQAVPWHEPRDWKFDTNDPRRGLGNLRPGGFLVTFADGHVQFISNDADPSVIRAMMTMRGGEILDMSSAGP